jgi:hypothetical protein
VSIVEDIIKESDSQPSEISENATALAGIYLPKSRRITFPTPGLLTRINFRLAVTRPRSVAAMQNCHFHNSAADSDASQNGSGLVTLVFAKCENKMPVLTVWDSPYGKRWLGLMLEQLCKLCVRRGRGGQGELKSCTARGSAAGPQATAMRLND